MCFTNIQMGDISSISVEEFKDIIEKSLNLICVFGHFIENLRSYDTFLL